MNTVDAPILTLIHYLCPSWVAIDGSRTPNYFKTIAKCSASLKVNFDDTMAANLPRMDGIPPSRQDSFVPGIRNGAAKSREVGFRIKGSEAHKNNLTGIVRENFKRKTAPSAKDTRLLAQCQKLQKSHQQLPARVEPLRSSSTSTTRSRISNTGSNALPHAAAVSDTRIIEHKSYSATIEVNIVHQASVNRLEGGGSRYWGEAISDTVEAFFSNDKLRGSVRISTATLLDSGNVEIITHAEHRGDIERLLQTMAWYEAFERQLGPIPVQTYIVRIHNMRIGFMEFSNRKEKSTIIRRLVESNFPDDFLTTNREFIIKDISWCCHILEKRERRAIASLIVEFSSPEHANQALTNGLLWQDVQHACNTKDLSRYGIQKCLNCQHYGHNSQTCSAEPQCGRCAGLHSTHSCTSKKMMEMKCAVCSGAHPALGGCPVHRRMKRTHNFPTTLSPPVAEPIAEDQERIKIEPNQPRDTFRMAQISRRTPRTLLEQTGTSKATQMGRDIGLQSQTDVQQKRKARDISSVAEPGVDIKRIKQEDLDQERPRIEDIIPENLKQEESSLYSHSMAPWRQPSRFIAHRP